MRASINGKPEVVKLLLQKGAYKEAKDKVSAEGALAQQSVDKITMI